MSSVKVLLPWKGFTSLGGITKEGHPSSILVQVEFWAFLLLDFVLRRFKKSFHSGAMELFFEEA